MDASVAALQGDFEAQLSSQESVIASLKNELEEQARNRPKFKNAHGEFVGSKKEATLMAHRAMKRHYEKHGSFENCYRGVSNLWRACKRDNFPKLLVQNYYDKDTPRAV